MTSFLKKSLIECEYYSQSGRNAWLRVSGLQFCLGIRRAELLKYSCEITLDPNTAHNELLLSEENRKVTWIDKPQSLSSHPDRFTDWFQVLSRESLTGRCYWEVEWSGIQVHVAVAYKNISRAGIGNECEFGANDKSWALYSSQNGYQFGHNNIWTSISGPDSSRVGVYLDHRAGILSFYSVSETMTLLHRVQTTFTQPLHAGVLVCYGESADFWCVGVVYLVWVVLFTCRLTH
uniref:B30.2/SPRY domain-containing protein n=1 Tax=Fundulus heteroclitus TaxID=8078 RepID=A0A3Q2Q9S3_FUNHE